MSAYRTNARVETPGKRLRTRWVRIVLSKWWSWVMPLGVVLSWSAAAALEVRDQMNKPPPVAPCGSRADIHNVTSLDQFYCEAPLVLTTEKINSNDVLMKCICPSVRDGGAP